MYLVNVIDQVDQLLIAERPKAMFSQNMLLQFKKEGSMTNVSQLNLLIGYERQSEL